MKFRILSLLVVSLLVFDASAKVRKTKKAAPATTEQQNAPSQITIKGKVQFTYKGYWNYDQPAPEFKMTVYQYEGTQKKSLRRSRHRRQQRVHADPSHCNAGCLYRGLRTLAIGSRMGRR